MHTGTKKKDVSLAKKLKHYLEGENLKNGVIDQGKPRKRFTERKWTERKYHDQDIEFLELKDVKMYCTKINSQQYPSLVHIPNLMAQGGWARIIIYVLIQK